MELTYRDIMDAKFDGLTTAATQWRRMSRAFGSLRTDYTTHVGRKLSGWHGDSSAAYRISEIGILEQIDKAKHQATSTAQLLENARDMLSEARDAVKAVRKDAVHEGGMNVDEYGKCTFDTSNMTGPEAQSALRDPTRADTERAWNNAIQRAVEGVQQIDTLIMGALKAAATDGDPSGSVGFNGDAPKDFTAFAKDLAERQAEKAEKAKEKSVHLSTNTLRGIVHGVQTFARFPGRLDQKMIVGAAEGFTEAAGYNQTQGLCANVSVGSGGRGLGGEGCLVITKKRDGGAQISTLYSSSVSSAGLNAGSSASFGVLKSNAATSINCAEGHGTRARD